MLKFETGRKSSPARKLSIPRPLIQFAGFSLSVHMTAGRVWNRKAYQIYGMLDHRYWSPDDDETCSLSMGRATCRSGRSKCGLFPSSRKFHGGQILYTSTKAAPNLLSETFAQVPTVWRKGAPHPGACTIIPLENGGQDRQLNVRPRLRRTPAIKQ
ncbi:hypothetical protein SCHPADRAFT_9208 [Schizopora paradoxa]|uniref:Uncharacterized protein n=1 Tax=Schizopora paradoxa TaxID=27342 RepID=A0A0H2SFE0_9AGAM|nr:hypothetical protein SCHPADRAFT_9208 [Schizopora paradoxa]